MLKNYFRIACRVLLANKTFVFVNILGLAIGMTCFIIVWLYANYEQSYDQYEQNIARVHISIAGENGSMKIAKTAPLWGPLLTNDYPIVKNWVRIVNPGTRLIGYKEKTFKEQNFFFADSSLFDIFSFKLISGDPKTLLNAPYKVVISESMSKKYFGNENPVGKIITPEKDQISAGAKLLSEHYEVTGIMEDIPRNTHFHADFFASFSSLETVDKFADNKRAAFFLFAYTYLLIEKEDMAELEKMFPNFIEKYIGENLRQDKTKMSGHLMPVSDIHLHSNMQAELETNSDIKNVYLILGLGFLILIVACLNFINLSTAQAIHRTKEASVRKALGGNKMQLFWQFIGEYTAISLISLLVALSIAQIFLPDISGFLGKNLHIEQISWWFLPSLVVFVSLLSNVYPSFFLSSTELTTVLRGGLKNDFTKDGLRKILVICQLIISISIINFTAVIFSQLQYMQSKKLGFNMNDLLVIQITDNLVADGFKAFSQKLLLSPNVISVASSMNLPYGQPAIFRLKAQGAEESIDFDYTKANYDYAEAMGFEFLAGRNFSREFSTDSTACIINETAAKYLSWVDSEGSYSNAIGKEIYILAGQGKKIAYPVIGVVRDFNNRSLRQPIIPFVFFFENAQARSYMIIKINNKNKGETMGWLEQTWKEVFPNRPLEYSFVDEEINKQYQTEQKTETLFTAMAGLSIFVCCLGLYGLISFTTQRRFKEIGIRKTLGATASEIATLFLKDFALLFLVSSAVATPLAYFSAQAWLADYSYRVDLNLWIFISGSLLVFVIAGLTIFYKILTASLANPVNSLRDE